ncbi:MAG: YHYH protein [Gammaproteobacteria bacterium]
MLDRLAKNDLQRQQKLRRVRALAPFAVGLLALAGCQSEVTSIDAPMGGLDPHLFMDGAISASSIVDCTLSDGSESLCRSITIAGYPLNHDIGPFCPPTITSGEQEGGIWFDGNAVYDMDGPFISGLSTLYEDDNWRLYNEDGSVRITDTAEAFAAAARPDVDPQYQNYCVEGRMEWLENGDPITTAVLIPTAPVIAESAGRAFGNLGITLNGVVIAASAPVDAILGAYTIAAFDDCGGHINPFEGYHLHGARGCSEVGSAESGETPIFGYAMDGFPIHSPLEGGSMAAGLDECQGHTSQTLGYHYHAANAEENSVLSCFSGLIVEGEEGEGPPGGPPPGARPGGPPPGARPAGPPPGRN